MFNSSTRLDPYWLAAQTNFISHRVRHGRGPRIDSIPRRINNALAQLQPSGRNASVDYFLCAIHSQLPGARPGGTSASSLPRYICYVIINDPGGAGGKKSLPRHIANQAGQGVKVWIFLKIRCKCSFRCHNLILIRSARMLNNSVSGCRSVQLP